MFSLFIRNLIFAILQPGIVAGLIPYLIIRNKQSETILLSLQVYQYAGVFLFAAGFIMMISCIISFALRGEGTLSPADPTKKLVISGLYRYSRNPMYVGVTLILMGEAIFFHSTELCFYSLFVFIAFFTFTVIVEEPRLRKEFGEDYKLYCKRVRRWI